MSFESSLFPAIKTEMKQRSRTTEAKVHCFIEQRKKLELDIENPSRRFFIVFRCFCSENSLLMLFSSCSIEFLWLWPPLPVPCSQRAVVTCCFFLESFLPLYPETYIHIYVYILCRQQKETF